MSRVTDDIVADLLAPNPLGLDAWGPTRREAANRLVELEGELVEVRQLLEQTADLNAELARQLNAINANAPSA